MCITTSRLSYNMPTNDAIRLELRELARRTGGRTRSIKVRWPELTAVLDTECRFTSQGQTVRWSTNREIFCIEVERETTLGLAAGRPCPWMAMTQSIGWVGRVKVFASRRESSSPRSWISQASNQTLLGNLRIEPNELLLIARNKTILVAEPAHIDADWERLENLLRLVSALPTASSHQLDVSNYPPNLKKLSSLIGVWAISDDRLRADHIEAASNQELRRLAKAALPRLPDINEYLASVALEDAEAASLLDDVAQAAIEAANELRRRELRAGSPQQPKLS